MHVQTAASFFDSFLSPFDDKKITIRFIRDRDKTGTIADSSAGIFGDALALLPRIKKQNADTWGAFFAVNYTGSADTHDADVQYARALFIDIDNGDLPAFFPVEPSCILSRTGGGGYHIYWFLSSPDTDLEKWKLAQKTLIHFYKSDKTICNPARVMRIPGTVNHKEKYEGSPVYEITATSEHRYSVDAVVAGHTDKKMIKAHAIRQASSVFPREKMEEGDGRHTTLIKASYILHDYNLTQEETFDALRKMVYDKFVEPIDDDKIMSYVAAQKSAKNVAGAGTVDKALKEQAKIDRVKELVADWYYVRQQDLFFQEGSNVPVTTTGFNAKFAYAADMANPARFCFLNDCIKQYESLVYDPAEARDIDVIGGIDRNMYLSPNVVESDKTPDWFLDHITYLMPNEVEREHFLNYFAYLAQNPGKKVMHGVLVIGKQGIGKSILQKVFSQVFGESNVVAPHNENLSGQFTGCFKHCQIVIINELMQVDKKDFNNKIKPFITEPNVEIREMYKAPYTIKNCMNIVAFSNHENAIYVDKDDRRWFIVQSPAAKKSPEYYDALIEAMESRSGEVMYYLKHRDVSAFRPGAEPPMTTAKQVLIGHSMSELEACVLELIESGASPCDADMVTIEALRDGLPRHMQNGYATGNRLAKILRDHGCVLSEERIRVGGVRKRFWILRDMEKYRNKDVFRAAVESIYGKIEEEKNSGFVQ